MTSYLLQTIAFQLLFLIFYEWALKKETFFQWNRLYLLFTPLLAMALPFVQIPALGTVVPQNLIVALPTITLGTTVATAQSSLVTSSTSLSVLEIILILGMAVSALLFMYKLYKIIELKRKGRTAIIGTTTLVHLPNSTDAFSFAGTIFLGESLNEESKKYILAHEQVHLKQKHYVDLLYFEVLRIAFWFNPLVYFYQKRIATLHEYIADAHVVATTEKTTYYQNLLAEVFQIKNISFINTFFNHSLIKKRIVMLHKSKSKKTQLVKFLMVLPLIAGIMLYTSCSQDIASETSQEKSITQKIEELKFALENKEGGLTISESNELYELVKNAPLKGIDERNAISLFNSGELDALPFAVIDQVPLYPGCKNLSTNEERKNCMSEKLNRLVIENFDTKVANGLGLNGKVRLAVQFRIDEKGNVVDILSRAPINALEVEAKRVINLIPQMQPGQQDGKAVGVLYSLPIVFQVKE